MTISNTITDTALIFEGGGMRASYTSGFLNVLLENHLYFHYVAGISAGASNTVNYLVRNPDRAKKSFVDLASDPNFGNWLSFLKGEGYFRAQYIYEETPWPNAALPFDFDAFMNNPAEFRLGAFEMASGRLRYFSKKDVSSLLDLMKIVRASSSMPVFMPPTEIDNTLYVDGGIAGGIALDIAKKDGYKKFFVVLSRPRGYRKKPGSFNRLLSWYFRRYPLVAQAMAERHKHYNATLDELEQLEKAGQAFLVYPQTMSVSNKKKNVAKLNESYQAGYAQGQRDVPLWKQFLGV